MPLRRPPPATLRELEIRAEALAGRTIGELATALELALPGEPRRAKGFVGALVERALGADPAAGDGPDFPGLGVELKSIPVGASGRPAESTFVCSIRMSDADDERWEGSRLERRLRCVLFVPVQAARLAPLPERRFAAPVLWRPTSDELASLRADWEDLIGAIGAGRGGTLSAREGRLLQVRPKAATASERTLGPTAEQTLPLGFYLRASFTAAVLARSAPGPRP